MKGRSTLFILIGIVALGVFIWAQESWRARNPAKALERVRLFNLDARGLTSIEFIHTNGVVRCVKENGVWLAGDAGGSMGRADEALIQRMVAGLNSMGKGTTITEEQLSLRGFDAAEYGFDTPAVTITAVDNQGRHGWLIGRSTPLGDMVYAKATDAEEIYTISNKLMAIVPASHEILRDQTLFSGDAAGVRRVEIRGSAGFAQLVKEPQVGWRVQQPVSALADSKEVDDYLRKLYGFRIKDFIADNVSDFSVYGLQAESRQISLVGADGSSRMLMVGDDYPDRPGFVYARRADDTSVFTLSADILQLLNVPAKRFRDAGVLSVPLATVSSVVVSRGEERLSLAVDDSKTWKIASPVVWDASAKAVSDLIIFWGSALITEFNVVTNQAPAEWVFEIGSAEAGVTNRIEVLPNNGSLAGLLIRRDDDPAIYQINLPAIPSGVIDPLAYKDRIVWSFSRADVSKVSITRGATDRQTVARMEDGSFAPAETNGNVRVNDQTIGRLLRELERVRTTGYITYNPRDLEIYGLATPLAELRVGLSGTNELGRVLLVGSETPDGFYSMVKGRDVVFYLEKPVVNILTADLMSEVERAVPPAE